VLAKPSGENAMPVPGDTLDGRYVLKREIARGTMSIVFEACHRFTGRNVAIKVMHAQQGANTTSRDRLLRESKLLTMARHPNIVAILDAGPLPDGQPYLVMEMLEGRSLEGIITSKRSLPVADTVHIARQVCEALTHAHTRGVVHRDIKPNNIFLSRNDVGTEVVKLIDFGFASLPSDLHPAFSKSSPTSEPQHEFVGTPEYTPPTDFFRTANADPSRDLYALGIVMYECLMGFVPFTGTTAEITDKFIKTNTLFTRKSRPEINVKLSQLIDTAVAPAREHRFADARTFMHSLVEATGLPTGTSKVLSFANNTEDERSTGSPSTIDSQPAPASFRRQFARVPYVTPARVIQNNGIISDGRTEDISEGGMLLMVRPAWTHRDAVKVRFAVPISGHIITCEAVARWSQSARNTHAIGLEFMNLPEPARDEIARYVDFMGVRE